MTLESRWNRATHDAELKRLHDKKFSEYALAEMLEFSVSTIQTNLRRLGLPSHKMPRETATERPVPIPKEKPNPISVAHIWLGRRLVEKPSGYWLDDRPVSLDILMRETNRLLKANGCEQVGVEKWRV